MADNKTFEALLGSVRRIDTEGAEAQKVFRTIADNIFKYYAIRKGDETFRFLEIEFYYYSKAHNDYITTKEKPFVYKRYARRNGLFFLHDSGVDICFKTEDASFGGILIRTLLRERNGDHCIVTGPWDCRDALFNYTNEFTFPKIVPMNNVGVKLAEAKRYNADKAEADMSEARYCFYDEQYRNETEWKYRRYDAILCKEKETPYNVKPWNRK